MDSHQGDWCRAVAGSLLALRARRRMEGSYAPSAEQARREILAMIPPGAGNAWSISEGQAVPGRIQVKLIGEELGC